MAKGGGNRRKGGKYQVAVITDSEDLMGKIIDLIADEYDDEPEFETDMNFDGSSLSRTIKINEK